MARSRAGGLFWPDEYCFSDEEEEDVVESSTTTIEGKINTGSSGCRDFVSLPHC
jgi:hypothetical protein